MRAITAPPMPKGRRDKMTRNINKTPSVTAGRSRQRGFNVLIFIPMTSCYGFVGEKNRCKLLWLQR